MAATTATLSMIISAKDYATDTLNKVGGSLNTLERNVQKLNQQFQQFRTGVNRVAKYATVAVGAITAGVSAIAYFGQETENAMANASTMYQVTSEDFKKYLADDVSYYAKKYAQNMFDHRGNMISLPYRGGIQEQPASVMYVLSIYRNVLIEQINKNNKRKK